MYVFYMQNGLDHVMNMLMSMVQIEALKMPAYNFDNFICKPTYISVIIFPYINTSEQLKF
jgi:hypothetical protein